MRTRTIDLRVTVMDDNATSRVIYDIVRNTKTVQAAVELNTAVTPPIEYDETRQEV